MHGRKKDAAPKSEEEKSIAVQKIEKYRALEQLVMKQRRERIISPESLGTNAKLLSVNPDHYSLWNYRREMLQSPEFLSTIEGDEEAKEKVWKGELALTVQALQRNPKSYNAWHQRRWVVEHGAFPIKAELHLCGKFLESDERNFHCWHYRAWVAERGGSTPAAEFDFTTEKINHNFSNGSAWHYRTTLIPKLNKTSLDDLSAELELVQSAVYTEPDDQSPWMYHRWLISLVAKTMNSSEDDATVSAARGMLTQELDRCQELFECEEERIKWPLAAIAAIKKHLKTSDSVDYDRLKELDPLHTHFYTDATPTVT